MSLSPTISVYLCDHDISYEVINHPYSENAIEKAQSAQIESRQLAKAVVMENQQSELFMVLTSGDKSININY